MTLQTPILIKEQDPAWVMDSFIRDGIEVVIPAGEAQTELILVQSTAEATNVSIHAEEGSQANIYIEESADSEHTYVEVIAEKGAVLQIGWVKQGFQGVENKRIVRSRLHEDAQVNWYEGFLGEASVEGFSTHELVGVGAFASVTAMAFEHEKAKLELDVSMIQKAPHTRTQILSRGVISDQARFNHRGLVRIESNAVGAQGDQDMKSILLSDEAHALHIPMMEVENDDVQCSHSASVGKIDDEQLFYFMCRGLTREKAKKELIRGMFTPLIQNMPKGFQGEFSKRLELS